MKKIFLIVFLLLPLISKAQDTIKSIRFLNRNWKSATINFSASIGREKYYRENYSYNDLLKDTRHSENFYNFDQSTFNEYGNFSNPSYFYQLSISFNPYQNKQGTYRNNHELRLGINFYRGLDNYLIFYNQYHRVTYGIPAPDTSYLASVKYEQLMDQAGVEASYILRSNNFMKRFSLFCGLNVGMNYTLYSSTKETVDFYYVQNVCFTSSTGTVCYDVNTDNYTYSYFRRNPALILRASFPYGLDFRLMSQLFFFMEGRTGLAYQKFIHGKSRIKSYHNLGLGVRFKF